MKGKLDWNNLSHLDKLRALRDSKVDQIVNDYETPGVDVAEFRRVIANERALWKADQFDDKLQTKGAPPNKEVVLGAWRDLDRPEAILELTDNSIDAWLRRWQQYPDKAAPELNIYIDIDSDTGQLTYEDNAGGVSIDNLENLVIPGYSETDALFHSIGSYKTGGKKAIFRLATAVNITTRYWNPAETTDDAVSLHLDDKWLTDINEYKFPYHRLKDKGAIQKGQTRYLMQLRAEPKGNPWYSNPSELGKIERDIQKTYSLLMARHKEIHIYFPKRGRLVVPKLATLYDFSGTNEKDIDIRHQSVRFNVDLDYEGHDHAVIIEIVIGCRVTTGGGDGKSPGFDLYGNDRLFVSHDQRLFAEFLPKGNQRNLIRGFVNILGPNVFIPWDTHKRHLNYDRDIIELLRSHPAVRQLIENWGSLAKGISDLGAGVVTKVISTPVKHLVNPNTGDFAAPHQSEVKIDANRKRGQKLPDTVFIPELKTKKTKKDSGIKLSISLPTDDARQLAAYFEVQGSIDAAPTKRELSEKLKTHLLHLARKGSRK